jgi:hypothetical protein
LEVSYRIKAKERRSLMQVGGKSEERWTGGATAERLSSTDGNLEFFGVLQSQHL